MSAPKTTPEEQLLPPGRQVASRYTIESKLGEGATGVVYLARRDGPSGGERVALKVIHRHLSGDRQIYKRFHREAAILKRLEGDHLVKLYDFIEDDGLLIIALEYIHGTSLEALLQKESPLGPDRAVQIALEVCAALESAHAAGVVHRDLKPGNVLLEAPPPASGGPRSQRPQALGPVRVVDFGLAKVVQGEQMSTNLTEQDMIFGTPEYMAPEQVRGDEVDLRCDIYALGCMLYEMAVGSVPFQRRTAMAIMAAHLTEEPPLPRSSRSDGSVPAGLEAVILRALAKQPQDRYESARAFAEALAACRSQARVITPLSAAAGTGVAITEVDLSRSALEHSPTIPSDVPMGPARCGREIGLAATLPLGSVPTTSSSPPPTLPAAKDPPAPAAPGGARRGAQRTAASRSRERWLWIVVAVVFAAIGVAIGTLFGTR